MAATEHARTASLPGFAELAAGDRPGAYVRATWATFLELARYVAGPRARNLARTAVAHTAIETGWGVGLFCWNPGNIMASGEQPWFSMVDHRIVGETMEAFTARFAYFRTLRAGVTFYYNTLSRYGAGRALELASEGDPQFFPLLRATGYFGGFTYKHGTESAPRPDTDAELAASFAGTLGRVDAELEPLERRARGVRAFLGTVALGSLAALAVHRVAAR